MPQSLIRFSQLLAGHPRDFALMYSCGNILSIAGTSFIVGPCRQVKNMFKKNRWVATVIYLAAIGVTVSRHKRLVLLQSFSSSACSDGLCAQLFACLDDDVKNAAWGPLVIVVAVASQFFALMWYIFSYIPFARTCVTRCLKNCGTKCIE